MGSMVFSALAMEAYVNHVGALALQRVEDLDAQVAEQEWNRLYERRSAKTKLKQILTCLGANEDMDAWPYDAFCEAIEYRHKLAHGKVETLRFMTDEHPSLYFPSDCDETAPVWMQLTTGENARRFLEATEALSSRISELSDASPVGSLFNPIISSDSATWSA